MTDAACADTSFSSVFMLLHMPIIALKLFQAVDDGCNVNTIHMTIRCLCSISHWQQINVLAH